MTTEARAQRPQLTEQSPIRNDRLRFADLVGLERTHRLTITATSTDGSVSRIRLIPLSIRKNPNNPAVPEITFLFEGSDEKGSFGFHRLDGKGEVMQIKPRGLIDLHTSGHLVKPDDCRSLSNEHIEIGQDWDMAFDVLRDGLRIPIAAHNVQGLTIKKMKNEIVLPRGLQRHIDLVEQAPRF